MSRTYKDSERKGYHRRISVRGVRRNPPDIRKLSRALIQLALEKAATDAATQEQESTKPGEAEINAPETKHD